ncbi:MAG: DUF1801 domain-containing protein [Patescibacteria group bacterium]
MKTIKSNDQKVEQFLKDLAISDDSKSGIIEVIRFIIFENYPLVKERIMYGGIMFSNENDFGGVFVSKKHVSFEFGNGYLFNDKNQYLEGTGQFRRHLKFTSLTDIEDKNFVNFLQQAIDLESK